MGKRIITQARGKGSTTYRAHSFRWGIKVKHRRYDEREKTTMVKGKIIDLKHNKGFLAPVAIVHYEDNEMVNMFAPEGIRVNEEIQSGINAEVKRGNTLPLRKIPEGTMVYNIELKPGDGGKLCRAPGLTTKVISNINEEILLQLPSKKQKKVNGWCRATIGTITGKGRKDKPFVKAGKVHHIMRARGKLYPRTSGVAMNAVDHPFGSGRGRQHAKVKSPPRFAPPGRNVGPLHARKSGRSKGRKD